MKNATLIALILDRSGSIGSCLGAMQTALDEFIGVQKKEPGECEFALFQFNDSYEQVYRGPIDGAPEHKIVPRGTTALHDAMGRTILSIGEELGKRPESERPNKVIVCTITDAYDNVSREFTKSDVRALVTRQREKYQWNFVFLGANQDAVLTGMEYNIPVGSTMTYAASAGGIRGMSMSLNSYVSEARSSNSAEAMNCNVTFKEEDRTAAMDGTAVVDVANDNKKTKKKIATVTVKQ